LTKKGRQSKIHRKRKMNEAKQEMTKEASIKTKNHRKRKMNEAKKGS
jgi:hypothetical protein